MEYPEQCKSVNCGNIDCTDCEYKHLNDAWAQQIAYIKATCKVWNVNFYEVEKVINLPTMDNDHIETYCNYTRQ